MVEPLTGLQSGLWGVLATPFAGPGLAVDEESLRRQVHLYRQLPATGLVVLGVFGEGAALDSAEQRAVVTAVHQVRGPLPMVVGLSARSTAAAVEQAQSVSAAASHEVAALMVQIHSPKPGVVVRHLREIHEASGAGIVVQDYPVVTGVQIATSDLLAVVSDCPFVVAVKSERPPTGAVIAELTAGTDVPVFGGLGGVGLLDELVAGASGAMTGFSYPEGLLRALEGWQEGGYPAASAAFQPWLPLAVFEAQPDIGLAIRKESLRLRGVFAESAARPPASPMPELVRPALDAHLAEVRGLVA
jgi:4-hydroxy-tetrahydrodipicolinate synthase